MTRTANDSKPPLEWQLRQFNKRFAPYYLISPSVVILLSLFGVPVVLLVTVSFYTNDPLTGMSPAFDPGNYIYYWTQPYFLRAVLQTFMLAFLATLLTALLSYPLALILAKRGRKVRVFGALVVVLPLFVSVVERNLGWVAILGREGAIDSIGQALGVQLPLILYTDAAIVLGLANTLMPYMFLAVFASVRNIDPSVPFAASTLGASPWKTFWRVTFPLTLPGLSAGFALVFALASSAVVTISMLGGGRRPTLPTLLLEQATVLVNYPRAATIAVSLCVLIIIIMQLVTRWFRGSEKTVMPV